MKRNLTLFALVLTLCGEVLADQIALKNGDRVTGKIVKSDAGKLVIKSELLGDVTVDLSAVTNITGDQQLYVTLADGRTVSGVLTASGDKAELRASNSSVISIGRSAILLIRSEEEQLAYQRSLDPGWLEGWSGGADVGLALTSGNSDTTNLAIGLALTREYRINFDGALVTNISRRIGWQLTLSDRYLSDPPLGFKKNDLLLTTGLKIKLGGVK